MTNKRTDRGRVKNKRTDRGRMTNKRTDGGRVKNKRTDKGRMTNRDRELVPDNRSLVSKRALTTFAECVREMNSGCVRETTAVSER